MEEERRATEVKSEGNPANFKMKPWRCTYHTGASPVGRFLHSPAFLVSSSLAVYWLTIFEKDGKSLAKGKLGSHLPVLVQGNWYLVGRSLDPSRPGKSCGCQTIRILLMT